MESLSAVRLITAIIVVSRGISSALIVALLSASGGSVSSVPDAELGWICMASSGASESRLLKVEGHACFR